MTDFGQRLRKERESRDVTLRELSDATRIGKRYLEALESNDFDALPGAVFAKGYIRNYAEHLGLDPEPLIADYLRERQALGGGDDAEDEQAKQEAAQAVLSQLAAAHGISPASSRRRAWLFGGSLLVVIAAAALGWLFLGPSGPEPEKSVATAAPVVAAAEPEPSPPAPVPRAEPEPSPPAPVTRAEPTPETTSAIVATPALAPPDGTSQLSIADSGVGTGVENRQLVGRGNRFTEGATVWFWTRVQGGRSGDTIRHVWLREGRPQGTIELNIGGSHWRTQSRWSMRPGTAGAWAVEARDAEGRLLTRAEFSCVPAD